MTIVTRTRESVENDERIRVAERKISETETNVENQGNTNQTSNGETLARDPVGPKLSQQTPMTIHAKVVEHPTVMQPTIDPQSLRMIVHSENTPTGTRKIFRSLKVRQLAN